MLKLKHTGLEEFSFGDEREDLYYVLINRKVSPNGLDLEKIRLADPRAFDRTLEQMGCLIMLNGEEVDELARRGDLNKNQLHKSLYELAKEEGFLQ
ncbi:MAG: hypothetical protein FH748_16605 [Balneolaceae bacterium]|nr:hypothetical protein [Balneolaceae bacterium]